MKLSNAETSCKFHATINIIFQLELFFNFYFYNQQKHLIYKYVFWHNKIRIVVIVSTSLLKRSDEIWATT